MTQNKNDSKVIKHGVDISEINSIGKRVNFSVESNKRTSKYCIYDWQKQWRQKRKIRLSGGRKNKRYIIAYRKYTPVISIYSAWIFKCNTLFFYDI